jgi:hypothetical protein
VGAFTATADLLGLAPFSINVGCYFPFEWFAASATDLTTGGTSEFGAAVQANPGYFEFSAPTYSIIEADVLKPITVNRLGGSYGAVSVDYASSLPAVHPAKPASPLVPHPIYSSLARAPDTLMIGP